jgi:glycosyltransferase involved in cell wall biosynthesis
MPNSVTNGDYSIMDFTRSVDVTLIVLTRNEEKNLPACLESVSGWASEIFVVDSGSTDRTLEIAEQSCAEVRTHPFETHSKQWQWALANLPISTEWVLGLDADQRVTAELRSEISEFIHGKPAADIGGCFVKRKQIFRGRWIRHGGYYPKYLLKLFRREAVWTDSDDLVDHHFRVRGQVIKLNGDIIEDNRNEADISVWIEKHNRYAALQAREDIIKALNNSESGLRKSFFGSPDERVLWLKSAWNSMPLYLRPVLYFGYRYFFRLGFLDGKQGFIFHFLQAYWYRLLIDIKLDELRSLSTNPDQPPIHIPLNRASVKTGSTIR